MRLCDGITSVEKNIKFMRGKQGGTHMFGYRSIVHQPRFAMYRNTYLSQSLYNINPTPPTTHPPPPVTRQALSAKIHFYHAAIGCILDQRVFKGGAATRSPALCLQRRYPGAGHSAQEESLVKLICPPHLRGGPGWAECDVCDSRNLNGVGSVHRGKNEPR